MLHNQFACSVTIIFVAEHVVDKPMRGKLLSLTVVFLVEDGHWSPVCVVWVVTIAPPHPTLLSPVHHPDVQAQRGSGV